MPKPNYSWLTLLTFCTATALATALGLAILITGATLAFAGGKKSFNSSSSQAASVAPDRTYAGVITDSACRARHVKDSGKSPAECARTCVRKGAQYTLVDGERSYLLEGNATDVEKLAGQRAKITGTLDGSTIKVTSIALP